ncbi:MAG: hypothetical protein H6633_17200 [Anaerolineales bacterium]|nr:hypothetical protein [Anaerolineales bacterium]
MPDEVQTLILTINLGDDALPDEVNKATTQLYRELLASDADRVEKMRSDRLETGTKGDPITIGAIALALGAAAAPGVVEIVKDWLNRRHAVPVQVKIKLGDDEIELSGPASISAEEFEARAERVVALLKKYGQNPEG